MKSNLIVNTIEKIKIEITKANDIKDNKKNKYMKELDLIKGKYIGLQVSEKFISQYNQLNTKGTDLAKELKSSKDSNKKQISIEIYIRYLKASLYDFNGNTQYLRKYITSFLFSAILFLGLSPQFYGFLLPILFFLPIYMGLKGVKKRSISGFYMTMSLVPVAIMTSFTWIRYGLNAINDYSGAVESIMQGGINENIANILVYAGPILGCFLLIFSLLQLYRGYKSKDLFI